MTPVTRPLARRQLLKRGSAAALVFTAGPVFRLAQAQIPGTPDLVLLNLADLRSAYDRLPQLLTGGGPAQVRGRSACRHSS